MKGWADIGCFHKPVIDTEHQYEAHFGYEQKPEKERQAEHRRPAPPFKRDVVDLVDRHSQGVECRQQDAARQYWIQAENTVCQIGGIGTEKNESRMCDVDDVEHTERYRDADRYGSIKTSQKEAGNDGVSQKVEGQIH